MLQCFCGKMYADVRVYRALPQTGGAGGIIAPAGSGAKPRPPEASKINIDML
jgi:hypothetical protein